MRAGWNCRRRRALYLQRRFRRDLPTLYELLDTIDEAALQAQRRLTVPFIRQVLGAALARPCQSDRELRHALPERLRQRALILGQPCCTPATCEAP